MIRKISLKIVIILSLISLLISCSSWRNKHEKVAISQDQKIISATKNLQEALRYVRCKNHHGTTNVKEKAHQLITVFKKDDVRVNHAQNFLTLIQQIENNKNLSSCKSLVKKVRDDVDDFEKSLTSTKKSPHKNFYQNKNITPNVSEKSRKRFRSYEAI